jgi:WD40 repeat protein/tetratricopeptide (TPR) repeat protein
METGDQMSVLRGHMSCVCSVALSPDGARIASCGDDGTIRIWDASKGQELMTLYGKFEWINSMAFSPDRKNIALANTDGAVELWDVMIGEKVITLGGHEIETAGVAFSPDGRQIISGGSDKTIRIWDVNSGAELMALRGHKGVVTCVSLNPEGKRIISGGDDGTIKLWDAVTGKEIITLRGHSQPVACISYDRTGRLILSGSFDNTIKVWNAETGEELTTLRGHNDMVLSALFSLNGTKIISGSGDKTIKIWDLSTSREPMTMGTIGSVEFIYSISFSPDGKSIASASRNGIIKIWDTTTGAELIRLPGHKKRIYEVLFSPDGKRIISAGGDETIKIWDTTTGIELMTLRGHEKYIIALACSPDGRRIVSADIEGTIKVWDAITGVEVMKLEGHKPMRQSLIYTPDGTRIISAGRDCTIKIWDAANGTEILTIGGQKDYLIGIAVSPDGKLIASGSRQGTIKIFTAQTGNEVMTLTGHNKAVPSLSFSSDGKRLASCSMDGMVKVWDTTTGVELIRLEEGTGPMMSVEFSPDGHTIAACGYGGIIAWETTMPAGGYQARQVTSSAMKAIDCFYNESGFYYKVMEQLEADNTLDGPVRNAALHIVKSRLRLDADKLWKIASVSGAEAKIYQEALDKAEKANQLEPNDPSIIHAIGVAQYRIGAYQQALETLTQVERMKSDANEPRADVEAVIAMALHKLGRAEEAQTALGRMRILCDIERKLSSDNKDTLVLIIEAERLFAGDNTNLCTLWEFIKAEKIDKAAEVLAEIRSSKRSELSKSLDGAIKWLSRASYERAREIWQSAAGYAKIIPAYELVIRIDPNNVSALNDLAWLQVTCPEVQLRDGSKAVGAANKACELTEFNNHEHLSTLAAAYSEVEDYTAAVKYQKKAIELLPEDNSKELHSNYEARLKLYESGKPYHRGSLWGFSDGELVAWWKLDEVEEGKVIDSSGNGLNGIIVGDAKITSDPERGNVLGLDGDGDYVDFGSAPALNITGAITVTAWIKVRTFDRDWQAIVTKGDSAWGLYRNTDNSLYFYCQFPPRSREYSLYTGASGEKDVNDRKWHHITGVYDGKRIALFIDGMLDSQLSASGNTEINNYSFCIGNDLEFGGSDWNGLIDDVRIYSYALSAEEVKMLYEGKEPPREKKSE